MALASVMVKTTKTPAQAQQLYLQAAQKLRGFADKGWVVLDSKAVAVISPDRILSVSDLVLGANATPLFTGGGVSPSTGWAQMPLAPAAGTPEMPYGQAPAYGANPH